MATDTEAETKTEIPTKTVQVQQRHSNYGTPYPLATDIDTVLHKHIAEGWTLFAINMSSTTMRNGHPVPSAFITFVK